LDELHSCVFVIATSKRHDTILSSICELLNSGVIDRAVSSNISLSHLGSLFSFADGGDDIAKRNAEILKSSKIVIDVQKLRQYARNPFSQKSAIDTVRLESGEQNHNAPIFRLAGGQTCSKVVGDEITGLFIEIRIQLSSIGSQNEQGQDAKPEDYEVVELTRLVNEVYMRVRKVFDLAAQLFQATALGGEVENDERFIFDSLAPVEFSSSCVVCASFFD